jgi:hypothetical protein
VSAALPEGSVLPHVSTTDIVRALAERREIALNATYQIDAVLEMLARENGRPEFDLVVKAVLPRLVDLNATVLCVLNEDTVKTDELLHVVDRWSAKAVQP